MPLSISAYVGRMVFTSATDFIPAGSLTVLFTGSWRNFTMISLHSLPSRYSMKSLAVLGAGAFFMMPLGEIIRMAPSSG